MVGGIFGDLTTTGCPKKKLALGNTLFMTSGDVF